MSNRVVKYVGLLMALVMAVGIGAAIGGGVVYAAMKVANVTPQVTAAADVNPEAGIVVVAVDPEGPAAEAGVVRGDILLAVDDQEVNDLADLRAILEDHEPGDEVELTVLHGDEERTLTATLGDQSGAPYLGVTSCRGMLKMPQVKKMLLDSGALVVEVVADSPAEQAGLEIGERIVAVDGQEVNADNDLADLIAAYKPGDTVTLEVKGPGDEEAREVTVELGEHPDEEGKAYLGVRYRLFPHMEMPERPERFRMPRFDEKGFPIPPAGQVEQGVVIWHVSEDSPAAAAGLHQGDLITAIDGERVTHPRALADAIAEHEPGDTITLTVIPSGETEEREIEVTLGENPEEEGAAYLGVMLGGFLRRWRFKGHELPPESEPPVPFKFKERFDVLPFDLKELWRRFEFRFPPPDREIESTPQGNSI